ncbi:MULTISPECIES: phospholipase C [unclassified Bradyrhizobium]
MSVLADRDCKLDGNHANYFKNSNQSANLNPGQSLTVETPVLGSTILMFVESLDLADPSRIREVGGPGDEKDIIEEWQYVSVRARLFGPDDSENALLTWMTPQGWRQESQVQLGRNYDAGPFPIETSTPPRTWRLVVTNTSHRRVRCQAGLRGVYSRLPIISWHLTHRLLNHAFRVVLEALTIRASIQGPSLTLEFGRELAELEGMPVTIRRDITGDLPDWLPEESTYVNAQLFSVSAALRAGKVLLDEVEKRWQTVDAGLAALSELGAEVGDRIVENNEWRSDWYGKVWPDFLTFHSKIIVVNAELEIGLLPWHLAEAAEVAADVYIAFNHSLTGGHVLAISPSEYTGGLVDIAESLGVLPASAKLAAIIENQIAKHLAPYVSKLAHYLAEVLVRLVYGQGVFLTATSDGLNVAVRYTNDPELIKPRPPDGHLPQPPEHMNLAMRSRLRGQATRWLPSPLPHHALGAIPPEFKIHHPETLARLDKIETIVVLMMENRSFDHMLGYLRNAVGDRYEGIRGDESNLPPPGVSGGNIPIRKASEEPLLDYQNTGRPLTQIMISPYHGHSHVMAQVNGGLMDGFVRDYANKPSAHPELVMVYYTAAQLPTYNLLAERYCVADHWFCAHPGPTWPNRWATISGTIPSLENLDIDDPKLGYMNRATMFEMLRASNIPFTYFEQDVSILRMFNAWRTDDRFIVPFEGPPPQSMRKGEPWEDWVDHFEAVLADNKLPPVVFIDPNFVDVPPLSLASDDLAPSNLTAGQRLVARIYNALIQSNQWRNMLFVVTYDEHGGFFDHVPPPGTPQNPPPPEFEGPVPRIHPDGPEHLGVRVPALIISPYVSGGSVCKTVFDHTSILKTILVRHRNKISSEVFTSFGERVNKANHLGIALDLDDPRTDPLPVPMAPPRPTHGTRIPARAPLIPPTAIPPTSTQPCAARYCPCLGRDPRSFLLVLRRVGQHGHFWPF